MYPFMCFNSQEFMNKSVEFRTQSAYTAHRGKVLLMYHVTHWSMSLMLYHDFPYFLIHLSLENCFLKWTFMFHSKMIMYLVENLLS